MNVFSFLTYFGRILTAKMGLLNRFDPSREPLKLPNLNKPSGFLKNLKSTIESCNALAVLNSSGQKCAEGQTSTRILSDALQARRWRITYGGYQVNWWY